MSESTRHIIGVVMLGLLFLNFFLSLLVIIVQFFVGVRNKCRKGKGEKTTVRVSSFKTIGKRRVNT